MWSSSQELNEDARRAEEGREPRRVWVNVKAMLKRRARARARKAAART